METDKRYHKNKLEIYPSLEVKSKLAMLSRSFYLMVLLFCSANVTLAQDSRILFQPSQTAVNASNEELLDLTVKIVNKTTSTLSGIVDINIPGTLSLISKNKIPVSLLAGDSLFVPIKIFVTKRAASGKEHLIRILFAGPGNSILATAETTLRVYIKRNVNMFALVSNILLDPVSDSIKIPIRVTNPGNTAQKITLINRYPSIFQDNAFHTTTQFVIQPSAETLITFVKPVIRKMLDSEGFDVTFSGLYDNGDIFGMAYIRVQSARNERSYRDESLGDSYNLNSISVSSQSMFSPNQSYLVTGRGNLELPNGMLGYNVDLTTWKNSYSPPMCLACLRWSICCKAAPVVPNAARWGPSTPKVRH